MRGLASLFLMAVLPLAGPRPAPEPPPETDALDPIPAAHYEYTYDPGRRRDPFASARKRGPGASSPVASRPYIRDLILKGIASTPAGWKATLEDDNQKAHAVVIGTMFEDGQVTGIDPGGVTFRQDIRDPLSPIKTREVRKTLQPAD